MRAGLLALCAALAACSVGPPYVKPSPPEAAGYTASPVPAKLGAQQLDYGAEVAPHWWQQFGSPELDRVVERALEKNPGLEAAQHTLEQARFELEAARGIFSPQLTLGAGVSRQRSSEAASGGLAPPLVYNLYDGQLDLSYYPDAFGLNRLVAQDAQAQLDVAHEQLRAAQLVLEGGVANAAIGLASLEAQIESTGKTVADQREILALVRGQYAAGAVSQLQVATQQSELATTEAQLPALELERDRIRHLLATYLGEFPSQADGIALPRLAALRLPPRLPVSLPATLVRVRPDVRAAEAQLRAANARVGEAVARLYPSVQLSAGLGQQSNGWGAFFDPASRIWSLAAAAAAPLYDGGTLRAQRKAAEAAYQAVFANYRGAVLAAFRDVADALRALQRDADALQARARALDAAQTGFELARSQYREGATDYLGLLTSEVQVQSARSAYIVAETQRYSDSVALFLALGGPVLEN
ncbi:MAG TPA: efflux transporter outer membrane subunit [Burkholderiales bacterium]|nr:efflux transporter outer membrane subunit [Burkholderiales bacterium]